MLVGTVRGHRWEWEHARGTQESPARGRVRGPKGTPRVWGRRPGAGAGRSGGASEERPGAGGTAGIPGGGG